MRWTGDERQANSQAVIQRNSWVFKTDWEEELIEWCVLYFGNKNKYLDAIYIYVVVD